MCSLKMTKACESQKTARYRGNYYYFETSDEKIKMLLRVKCSIPAFTVYLSVEVLWEMEEQKLS